MTSPRLAVDSPYGRVYRHPATDPGDVLDRLAAIREGLLVPSVTNVIGVMDKPFLQGWHAKLAAEAAVDVATSHPGLIAQRPDKAKAWIKEAAVRHTTAAADLGTLVHGIVEVIARGEDPGDIPVEAKPFVESFHEFVDVFAPRFLHLEATCFGSVDHEGRALGYAGTADFVAEINGLTVVGDWKSGRSIHTEAAIQASALAHAQEIVLDDDSVEAMPRIDAGVVVHLTRTGFKAYPAVLDGQAWEVFCGLRRVWDFHAANLDSRSPLLLGRALRGPSGLVSGRDSALSA